MRSRIRLAAVVALILTAGTLSPAVSASAAGTTTLSGVVSGTGPGWDGLVAVKVLPSSGTTPIATAVIDPGSGAYSVELPAGGVHLLFEYQGTGNFLSHYYSTSAGAAAYTRSASSYVILTEGVPTVIDATISAGGILTGVAVGATGPLPSLTINASYSGVAWVNAPRYSVDLATGNYSVDRLQPIDVRVRFSSGYGWVTHETGPLLIPLGSSLTRNVSLAEVGGIEGTVTHPGGPVSVQVQLWQGGVPVRYASTSLGAFQFLDVPPGDYTIFAPGSMWFTEGWWGGSSSADATVITVVAHELVNDVDIVVSENPVLTVNLTTMVGGTPTFPEGASLMFYKETELGSRFFEPVQPLGSHWVVQTSQSYWLEPGNYIVRVVDNYYGIWGAEYYPDAAFFADAEEIPLAYGGKVVIDMEVAREGIDIQRITGTDRFGTAVKATQFGFPGANPDVPVVYIANGLNYPDALSAGPAAVEAGGALLTVTPTSIPAIVLAELRRLDPDRIVVVGGPTMVSEAVLAELRSEITPDVDRITGLNRYETSTKIALDAFEPGSAPFVFIATGNNFPDALAAGPAASVMGAPVILVNGSASTLDAHTRSLLDYLGAQVAFILGGPPSVSSGMEGALNAELGAGNVVRLTGQNRYETALVINQTFFGDNEYAFMATGTGFADALGGGALAGSMGSPLYLGIQACIFPYVMDDLAYLNVQQLTLLGGTTLLGPAVEAGVVCAA